MKREDLTRHLETTLRKIKRNLIWIFDNVESFINIREYIDKITSSKNCKLILISTYTEDSEKVKVLPNELFKELTIGALNESDAIELEWRLLNRYKNWWTNTIYP